MPGAYPVRSGVRKEVMELRVQQAQIGVLWRFESCNLSSKIRLMLRFNVRNAPENLRVVFSSS